MGPTGPSPTTVSSARMSMPGRYPASGFPERSVPWSTRRTPATRLPSKIGSAAGMPGQSCTAPEAMTCEATHWSNWPMERTRPPSLRRKGGMYGSSIAGTSRRRALRRPPASRSAARRNAERRLAPAGSRR